MQFKSKTKRPGLSNINQKGYPNCYDICIKGKGMTIEEILGSSAILMKKDEMIDVIGPTPDSFKKLHELAFSRNMPTCWRACWLMDTIAEYQPELGNDYVARIWDELPKKHPDGVTRSAIRMLARYDIPEDHQGRAADICLDWLEQEAVPVAIKAHAMAVLQKIAQIYPELSQEFITILEDQIPNNTVGFKARARHIIKDLQKVKK